MSKLAEALAKKYEQAPQLAYMWRVELPVLSQYTDPSGGALNAYVNRFVYPQNKSLTSKIAGLSGASTVSHRVYEFSGPFTSYDTEKRAYAGTFTYAASHSEIGTISIVVDEYEDGATLEYFNTWMKLITNPDNSKNPPAFYKRNIKYVKLTSMQTDIHISEYSGCFPTEIAPLGNSYENNGVMQYNITITCDNVKHTIVSVAGKEGLERELMSRRYQK